MKNEKKKNNFLMSKIVEILILIEFTVKLQQRKRGEKKKNTFKINIEVIVFLLSTLLYLSNALKGSL